MVASPFEQIEARLRKLEEFAALQHAANAITNKHIQKLTGFVEPIAQHVELLQKQTDLQTDALEVLDKRTKKG